jgi:branched-chain amino acid transport system permease protein
MTGIYLAIATLAFAIITEQSISRAEGLTGGFRGLVVEPARLFGFDLGAEWHLYYLSLALLVLTLFAVLNLLRSPTGRALVAIRDSEISAQSVGINLATTKTLAFAISAGITGLAGGLFAHRLGFLSPDAFGFLLSLQLLLMVVVGGLGSMRGAIYGALFIGFLPQLLAIARDALPPRLAQAPGLEPGIFGLILVLTILFEPRGIFGRWLKIKSYFQMFPLYRRATHKRQKTYLRTERLR